MTRKFHNYTPQTNPRHHEEEPHNTYSHKIAGRQLKKSNLLSLIAKLESFVPFRTFCVKSSRGFSKTAHMHMFTGLFEPSLLIYAVLPKFDSGTYLTCIALACDSCWRIFLLKV